MGETRMLTVIVYDIARNKVRARVAAALEARMVRVQDSVFEAHLTRGESAALFAQVRRLVEPGDLLRLYAIPQAGRARCRTHGGSPISDDGGALIL